MSYCDTCIHHDVCGVEGVDDEATTYCADRIEPCEDCISRDAAIKQCGFGMTSLLIADCLRRLPSVTPQPKTEVLDKIRAEIEQITDTMGVSYNQYVSKIDVLHIIDKYEEGSEDRDD